MNKKVPLSQLQCYAGFVYKSTLIESDFHKDISRVAQNGVGSPTCEPIGRRMDRLRRRLNDPTLADLL